MVSSASDGIYIRSVLECALGTKLKNGNIFADSSSAPTCDEERGWKSETLGWKDAMDSEQERLQNGTSTNR